MPLINMVFKGGGGFVLNPGENLFPWPPMSRVFATGGSKRSVPLCLALPRDVP